ILVSAGSPGSLARHVATHPERGHSDGVAALTLVVGLAAIAAILLAILCPLVVRGEDEQLILRLALGGMVVASAQAVLFSVLTGQQRYGRMAVVNAMVVVITAVASIS